MRAAHRGVVPCAGGDITNGEGGGAAVGAGSQSGEGVGEANAKLRETKAREGGTGAHGEDKNRRKKKDGKEGFELGSISGSKVLDAGLVVVMCCSAVCCFPCGGVAAALMA